MKTNIHFFLSYLIQFFLGWEMFQTKEKIKIHILYSITFFFSKSRHLWDNVEKYCRAEQATKHNIKRGMRIACWITMAGYVHALRMCNTAFRRQQWFRERTSVLLLCVHCLSCTFYSGNPLLTLSHITGPFVWSLKSRNWPTSPLHTYPDKNLTQIFVLAFQTRINVF
jgi:hypothetical protein